LIGASITVREEQQQKQFPRRSIFSLESETRDSTASFAVENRGCKGCLQRLIVRSVQKSGLRRPIDADSKSATN